MAGFPKAGEEYGGRYRIVRELGHGAHGIVYEAHDAILHHAVALKVVLPSPVEHEAHLTRFAREARRLARIRSRHIVGIHEYGENEDTVFFVTDLFPDGDLQHWLEQHGPLDRRSALILVAQVCEALADAHSTGVVHRDVKPGNVLLWNSPEGLIPYLGDFDIATDDQRGLTRTGALVGSPAYMAPERHFGHAADERGDLYSVGCLLWAVLTGRAPYSGTDFSMVNSHINDPAPQLRTDDPVDQRIDEVLAGCLQKDPARRPTSAADVGKQLLVIAREIDGEADLDEPRAAQLDPWPFPPPVDGRHVATTQEALPSPTPTGGDVEPEERRRRGGWPIVAVAAVVLLVGGMAATVGLWGGDDDRSPAGAVSTSPVGGPTNAAEPPPRPEPPRVSVTSGYRSVVFAAALPRDDSDAELEVEVDAGDGWEATSRRLVLGTPVGGAERCARFRSRASTEDGGQATSRTVRLCGRAEAPTVEFIRSDDPCVNSIGGPCTSYDVRVTGFRSNTSPLVTVRRLTGEPWCVDCDYDRIEVGDDGRGYLANDWKISRDEGVVVLDVAGVTGEFRVYY